MESNISNLLKESEEVARQESEGRKATLRGNRLKTLDSARYGNGYDLITGKVLEL